MAEKADNDMLIRVSEHETMDLSDIQEYPPRKKTKEPLHFFDEIRNKSTRITRVWAI